MATPLQVPGEYEGGLAKIRDLPGESFRELLGALQRAPSTYSQAALSSAVAKSVDTIAASDVDEIVSTLLSLYVYRDYSQSAILDVAEGVAQAMQENRSGRLGLSQEQHESLTNRLAELLNVEPLSIAVRAGRLSLESEHRLQETRIVTDIRPVFEPESADAPPKGAVILHTLKITYRADDETKNFFVALDTDDVARLLEQLERANSKAESLKAVLKAAQVPYIESE